MVQNVENDGFVRCMQGVGPMEIGGRQELKNATLWSLLMVILKR